MIELKFLKPNLSAQKIIKLVEGEGVVEEQSLDFYEEEEALSQMEEPLKEEEEITKEKEPRDRPLDPEEKENKSVVENPNVQSLILENQEEQKHLDFLKGEMNFIKNQELQKLLSLQKQQLEQKTLALKQYLTDVILPDLTEGILEICQTKPEDPVTHLIEFLKKKQL